MPAVPRIVQRLSLIVIVALVVPGWPPVIADRVVKKFSSPSERMSELTVTVKFLVSCPTAIVEEPLPAR